MKKITLFHLVIFEIQEILDPVTRLAVPIFDKCPPPPKKFFDQPLIFVIIYKHAKNQFILSAHS